MTKEKFWDRAKAHIGGGILVMYGDIDGVQYHEFRLCGADAENLYLEDEFFSFYRLTKSGKLYTVEECDRLVTNFAWLYLLK